MRLRSRIAVAVALACGYSSDSTPSVGTSKCLGRSLKKQKKKKKKKKRLLSLEHNTEVFIGKGTLGLQLTLKYFRDKND